MVYLHKHKDAVLWIGTLNKKIFKFSSRTLKLQSCIDLKESLKFCKNSLFKLFSWKTGKVLIFETKTGSGFIFKQDKRILSIFEFLEWLKKPKIEEESIFLKGLFFSTEGMSLMKYNLLRRKIDVEEICDDFFMSYKRILIKGDRIIQIRSVQSLPKLIISHKNSLIGEFYFGDLLRKHKLSRNDIPKIGDIKCIEFFQKSDILVIGEKKKIMFFKVNWTGISYLGLLNVVSYDSEGSISSVDFDAQKGKIWVGFGNGVLEFCLRSC